MAYYPSTLKTHAPADVIWDAAYSLFKVSVGLADWIFAAAFTALAGMMFVDVVTTYIGIEFAERVETGRLGVFLWNISMNRYDFYGMVWTWTVVYLVGVLVVSFPFSPFVSGWIRRAKGNDLADLLDVFRAMVVVLLTAYVAWETTAYVQIIPQINLSVDLLLRLVRGGG